MSASLHQPPEAAAGIMTKQQFAASLSRDPSALSHWIRTGKLHGDALIGSGRNARINVAVARAQLGTNLSLGHQLGYAQREPDRTILDTPPASPTPTLDPNPSDQARLLKARADREELLTEQARIEAEARNGTYLLTEDATREHGRRLAETIAAVERWLPDLAQKIAASATFDERAMALLMRAEFRALRVELARTAAAAIQFEEPDPPE